VRRILWNLQYGAVGKRARLISVADYYRSAVIKMGFPANQTITVLNCIKLDRIQDCRNRAEKAYDFLTFGWDFLRKGDDLILKACTKLAKEGYSFHLLLNGNEKTWIELGSYLEGEEPSWLVRGEPVSDVNTLFAVSGIFIQASRRETFSYAVCEAAYAGLPVLCSDMAGLEWAHDLPSVTFFENENVEQLYLLMKKYLDGKRGSDADIEQSRKLICERYSLHAWVNEIMEQYQLS